jgi:hypothetical protein
MSVRKKFVGRLSAVMIQIEQLLIRIRDLWSGIRIYEPVFNVYVPHF